MSKILQVFRNGLVKKLEYSTEGYFYYSVPFHKSLDELTICVSSQIGCPMKCEFCATGDMPFVRNLKSEEIKGQILDSFLTMQDYCNQQGINKVKVIAEGMGDSSFNIKNVVEGFQNSRNTLFSNGIERADFGISTVGNTKMVPEYKKLAFSDKDDRTSYDFQISLHSANNNQRKVIIPNMPVKKFDLYSMVDEFSGLARSLNQPMKFNYMLLSNNEGWCNYDEESIMDLVRLSKHVQSNNLDVLIKLTRYSETLKGFSSPDDSVYEKVVRMLDNNRINAYQVRLVGDDIRGACGQLHYER